MYSTHNPSQKSHKQERQDMERITNYDIFPSEPNSFFLLPGEQIILHKRQHVFAVIIPIAITIILCVTAMVGASAPLFFFYHMRFLIVLGYGLIITSSLFLITKIIIDWYFHMYIVTNRRILEVQYKPFFSQDTNDVLLDQVRCTEIDVKISGYIHGLIDVGDIIITFDRPTHQQEFVLHDVKSPKKIGTLLGHMLNTPKQATNAPTWFRTPTNDSQSQQYIFSEEFIPKKQFYNV